MISWLYILSCFFFFYYIIFLYIANIWQVIIKQAMNFCDRIKQLRESQNLLQRQLAANLEIDTPMFSKIERGERRAKREQVLLLAKLLNSDAQELLTLWLAEQVYDLVKDEDVASNALKVAEEDLSKFKNFWN